MEIPGRTLTNFRVAEAPRFRWLPLLDAEPVDTFSGE
jgi:hypothetical protein